MDVPGFMVGTKVEQAGIIGAKMLYAAMRDRAEGDGRGAQGPGAGYYVMCGKAYGRI